MKGPEKVKLSKKKKIIKESLSLSLIILLIFIFRSVFFEPFRIPSGSMIPTLMIGDFIIVNKFSYGFKVPFSDAHFPYMERPLTPVYISKKKDPMRGDVIVFRYPKDPSINYIKRVVGLPGDTIEIINKKVFINEREVDTEEISGEEIMDDMDDKFKGFNLKFYKSRTGKQTHIIQENSDNYYKVDYDKKLIPPDRFFVMGDNRDFSQDSRFWGLVPRKYIRGKAILVWFSMIFGFGNHDFKARPWRIGTLIK